MESLPIELLEIILLDAYRAINKWYISGVLVCKQWRDILLADTHYTTLLQYYNASKKLSYSEYHAMHNKITNDMVMQNKGIIESFAGKVTHGWVNNPSILYDETLRYSFRLDYYDICIEISPYKYVMELYINTHVGDILICSWIYNGHSTSIYIDDLVKNTELVVNNLTKAFERMIKN